MNSAAHAGHKCRICGASALREFEKFRALKRVTSDSRPWKAGGRLAVCEECGSVQKLVEPDWLEDIDRNYKSYVIYHQAAGKEQPIFAGGGPPLPRSLALAQYLDQNLPLAERAQVLDFGCGTGAALKTYSARYPHWTLYGAELSTQSLALLQKIPGFAELFTCPPADISMQFELITAFHAIEHVLDPVATLRDLSGRLTGGGILFVQVPDAEKNPYDLVIADHLMHFTLESLRFAALLAGLNIIEVSDAVLPKELSLIARAGNATHRTEPVSPDPRQSMARVDAQIDWLVNQAESANVIARASGNFGLFGSSISATWLAGLLGDRISFFVDEDKTRVGGRHMGKPIIGPSDIAADADVYVPLIPTVAASVANRLARPGIRFHTPPSFGQRAVNHEMVS